ncbi:MAG TPA: OmpA family protein [Lysobacter sp.]|nr:OmpA family protein [Lysobacter sp.]
MFDRIIEQAAGRFGLAPEKAKQLMGMLVGLIFNSKTGGPAGFLQAFRGQGLGDVVQSWLGGGPKQSISPSQLENALGTNVLGGMASKLGLPQSAVSTAAAAMLPDAVGELSQNGELPTTLPDRLRGWLGGLGDIVGDFGAWGTAAAATAAAGASRTVGAGVDQARDAARTTTGGLRRLLPWLVLGALVIAAFLLFRGCRREEAMAPPVAMTPPAEAPAATEGLRQAVERSTEAATAALAKLKPGAFTADDLVGALNLMVVHFDTDSANISADSQDILARAAEAIKQAPAGTRIEVGGHTDNTGDAAANQTLSDARAAAVVKRLGELGVGAGVLTSKGYGQDKPVADNSTEAGKAQNRRIEFTVMR